MPKFCMILARKLSEHMNFYDIFFARKFNKIPEFYMIPVFARKIPLLGETCPCPPLLIRLCRRKCFISGVGLIVFLPNITKEVAGTDTVNVLLK